LAQLVQNGKNRQIIIFLSSPFVLNISKQLMIEDYFSVLHL